MKQIWLYEFSRKGTFKGKKEKSERKREESEGGLENLDLTRHEGRKG